MDHLAQIVLLLGVAVAVIAAFRRLHVPSSLGYLLVGVILGPHTAGPTVYVPEFAALAEFGVVFLLFSIGLSFSLPQVHAMRHRVFGLGTAQVALTTAAVAVLLWLAGMNAGAAFVVGAVFAQSSSTIIGSQLAEQGEENTPHGRLGMAISVFQDVTAVPILVVIPVLGATGGADLVAGNLAWAVAKAVAAFALVFYVGRWALRPLFAMVSQRRSAELFTLTVLLIVLVAAWTTKSFGLSLAFGAFLAGMMLGETEFRHQVESSIRPFRDVLLGLFFVGIGMLIDPTVLPRVWHLALLGAVALMVVKVLVVALVVRASSIDIATATRTSLLLAVGGEFGLALLAIALDARVIDSNIGQITLTSVLLSMILGALLIRYNQPIASRFVGRATEVLSERAAEATGAPAPRVLIGGYGRVGHAVAVMLQSSGVSYMAFDTDYSRVRQGRADGYAVMYGDIADPDLVTAARAELADLVIITVDSHEVSLRAAAALSQHCPHVPIIARARDLAASVALMAAGVAHAYPETIEASLRLGATALNMLRVPTEEIDQALQEIRARDYRPVMEEEEGSAGKPGAA